MAIWGSVAQLKISEAQVTALNTLKPPMQSFLKMLLKNFSKARHSRENLLSRTFLAKENEAHLIKPKKPSRAYALRKQRCVSK